MKTTGLIILAIGLILNVLSGFDLIRREKIMNIGSIEITHQKKEAFDWSPLLGIGVMAVGAGVYSLGKKSSHMHISKHS